MILLIQGLFEMATASNKTSWNHLPCDVCDEHGNRVNVSVKYCPYCQMNLCVPCSEHHRRNKLTQKHELVKTNCDIGSGKVDLPIKRLCVHHKDEELKIYCSDCKKPICPMCYIENHGNHTWTYLETTAQQFRDQILTRVNALTDCVSATMKKKDLLKLEKENSLKRDRDLEQEILAQRDRLLDLLQRHTDELLMELHERQCIDNKNIEPLIGDIDTHLASLESCIKNCRSIFKDGTDDEICMIECDIVSKTDILLKENKTLLMSKSNGLCTINFQPTDFENTCTSSRTNVVGILHVKEFETSKKDNNLQPTDVTVIDEGDKLEKMSLPCNEINRIPRTQEHQSFSKLEAHSNSGPCIKDNHEGDTKEIAASQSEIITHSGIEKSVSLEEQKAIKEMVPINQSRISESVTIDQRQSIKKRSRNRKRHKRKGKESQVVFKAYDRPQLLRRIELRDGDKEMSICGIAILDKELYVLADNSSDIFVYHRFNFQLVRKISINGSSYLKDIASCRSNKCLYITRKNNSDQNCLTGEILRIDPTGNVINKWQKATYWGWLSVTDEGNVVSTVYADLYSGILEFNGDGKLVRQFKVLSLGVFHAFHAVKQNKRVYVLCHGFDSDQVRGVCLVDIDGIVVRRFCFVRESGAANFGVASHLNIDANGNILVADSDNCRVLMLDSQLNFVKEVVNKQNDLNGAWRLQLDEGNAHLYVVGKSLNRSLHRRDGKVFCFTFL